MEVSRARLRPVLPACLSALALALVLLAAGCDYWSGTVRIGFSGTITGLSSDLGVQGRNGATLAVEELNAAGGIAGRRVELLVADENDTPEAARAAVRELDRQGAAVVVGLMSSTTALAGLPEAEAAGLAVISSTATTTALTGKDDAFFRVSSDAAAYALALARLVADQTGRGGVLLLRSDDNPAFVESFSGAFAASYARLGGRAAGEARIPAGQTPDAPALVRQARAADAAAVVAICSPRELAGLLRELRPAAPDLRIYSSFWGLTPEFLEMAGAAAEGVTSCVPYPFDDHSPRVADFNARFQRRFGYPPSYDGAMCYEAVLVAARALELTHGRRQGVARALAGLGPVPGVLGDIVFDRFGDVSRPVFCSQVRGGRVRTLGTDNG
ncbi:MAG: ABC transporter substrate-binding protein [Thermodesulfobacteriota bacterium]